MATLGVLALQGGYRAHRAPLERLGHRAVEVRTAHEINAVDGLVLPGGESTTHLLLIERWGLEPALRHLVQSGKPLLATCAGLILCAREVRSPAQPSFGWLDVAVERNAYGRQLDSFEGTSEQGRPLVFIRAPKIVTCGPEVTVEDRLAGEPILVRQGARWGATYHPELTDDLSVHRAAFGEG